jgi:hypothetical protein
MELHCPDCDTTNLMAVKLLGGYPKVGNYFVCREHGWKWRDGRHYFGTFYRVRAAIDEERGAKMSSRQAIPFKAKYGGKCESCKRNIEPGQTIYYQSSGSKPVHVNCGIRPVQPKVKATRAKAPEVTTDAWEQEQTFLDWQKKTGPKPNRRRVLQFCGSRFGGSPVKRNRRVLRLISQN